MRAYDLKPIKDATKDLDKCTYEYVTCAYFNGNRELKSVYTDQFSRLPREDALKHFAILKEALRGTVNKNIFTPCFSKEEKEDGGLKSILRSLADARGSEATVMKLCEHILDSMEFESGVNYLMTAAWNTIDIKPKGTDRQTIDDASEYTFGYCLVSVCPAKLSNPGLSYDENTKTFRTRITDWVVEKPALALLYPVPAGDGSDLDHVAVFSKETLRDVITSSVGREKLPEEFEKTFEEAFTERAGEDEIPVCAVKPLAGALKKNAVTIKTDSLDIIEKRIIDGVEYVLIPVSEGITIEEKK